MLEGVYVAVDVGGTFTDLVAVHVHSGRTYKAKVRSTPLNPESGFLDAVKKLLEMDGVDPGSVEMVVHVNTIGTNLFRGQLGLNVPKVALVTTAGFRDVLEIGRQNRAELYNLFYQRPKPIVPRERRLEVRERVDCRGNVLEEVGEDELERVSEHLAKDGVDALAVSFLNSYVNPHNERRAKNYLASRFKIPVFTSYEVDPEHREYERTSTTVVNAALAPVVARYLEKVRLGLQELGIAAPVQIMSSAGGLVDVVEASNRPVSCIESGPAAGVIGAAKLAGLTGFGKVISLDMGGTTAKAGVVVDGLPTYVPEMEVGGKAHLGRMVKGSGYPVRFPSIDLAEVSAGGGTIIDVDPSGSLKVGPMSAGADPGPVCYGLGGQMPTITDANLVLNRVEHLLGGEMKLDKHLASEALRRVSQKAGMGVEECAWASLVLVNLQMARAIYIVTLERGLDPTEFVLFAFGGAGPMHAAELAQQIGIPAVVVPPNPGLFSSLGLLMTDMRYTYFKGLVKVLEPGDESLVENIFREIESKALSELSKRMDVSEAKIFRSLDLRYRGQGYEIEVEAERPFSLRTALKVFEEKHEATYGYTHSGENVEMVAVRVAVVVPSRRPVLTQRPTGAGRRERRTRGVFFEDDFVEASVVRREYLGVGDVVEGPAIVEEYDSTTVVPPGWRAVVDETGCMVMRR
ncbi:MAG: hydantoinase/oxoprolinase family protein [Candidatus Caldarchaeum sp.]|nr:hydantoinase/oxoprolinase family protein [Candidatus Caldarchaeum sp.]